MPINMAPTIFSTPRMNKQDLIRLEQEEANRIVSNGANGKAPVSAQMPVSSPPYAKALAKQDIITASPGSVASTQPMESVAGMSPSSSNGAGTPTAAPGMDSALMSSEITTDSALQTQKNADAAPSASVALANPGGQAAGAVDANGSKPAQPDAKPGAQPAKSAPPSPQLVLKEAIRSIQESGKETAAATMKTVKDIAARKPINLTIDQVVQALFFMFLGFQLLLIKLLRPSPWWLMVFTIMGTLFGLGFSFMYYYNKKVKTEACDVLAINLGLKGLQHLLGALPSWLNYTTREKINWLNSVLAEVWPFYDKGVCTMVKKMTEGIFEQALKTNKVPGIKKIGFKQLTFGDAPFRVESIHVSEKHQDAMVMELDVRWCGEANITLAIELSAGEFAKMCPRVTDISFVGSLRITLKPLVDQLPGFGAAVVTFRKPPRLKYRLDFGSALGGKYAANVVKPFINNVINNMLVNMLVWPQRMVVPIINTEEMQVAIASLAYRNQGLIKVTILKAEGLKKTDIVGSSDPFVELTTGNREPVATKVVKNSLSPQWNETFWLLVQEPHSQELQLSVFDKDFMSPLELLTLNIKDTFGAKELIGRCSIKLSPITPLEPEPLTKWFHLGEGDWADPEGCGKGCGRIQLTFLYRSLGNFKADELSTAEKGVVTMRILQASNLPRGGDRTTMTAYVKVRCGQHQEMTLPVTSRAEHKFTSRNVFEFYDVKYSDGVKFKVMEKTPLADDEIGEIDIGVSDIAAAADVNPLSGNSENGLLLRTFKMENTGGASLVVSVRFAPYF